MLQTEVREPSDTAKLNKLDRTKKSLALKNDTHSKFRMKQSTQVHS